SKQVSSCSPAGEKNREGSALPKTLLKNEKNFGKQACLTHTRTYAKKLLHEQEAFHRSYVV
ncbi:hypothetical protein, partial [uncultured Fibrobacter sp.]|uniref:hypothetical protein n=1 Tax=uncultured Fibrobacter sp. TaxID=261512 RepID=UPI0025DF3D10